MTQQKNHQYKQFVYNIYFWENFTALYVFYYLNLLEYGPGGRRSFVDSKHEKAEKHEFWPDSLSFEKYSYPGAASIKEYEDLIESILDFYGYDKKTHCYFSEVKAKRQRKRKQYKKVINEGQKDMSEKEEESQNSDTEPEEQEET